MKNKIDKIPLDEKQKQTIYCVLIVLVLILLAFGDKIALHFISKNPNPNNTVFKLGEKKDYNIEFLKQITAQEILKKINNLETFWVLSSRDSCETCKLFLPDIEEVMKKENKTGYFINLDLREEEKDYYELLEEQEENIKSHIQYTPYIMYFENGMLKEEIVGKVEKKSLEEFFKKMK